ncbi:MAG: hypothetical protein ACK5W0_04755 [Labrys sp. (in: a-proteobacteria)]
MREIVKHGYVLGTGAALNVEVGFVPDFVKVINMTDGDKVTEAALNNEIIPFTSGGVIEIRAGDTIVGVTSGARAVVSQVLLASGTWAAGTAAGFFVVSVDDVVGTFGAENVRVGAGTDDATVTARVALNIDYDTEVAAATGNAALSSFMGSATLGKGFTIGSTVSEAGKLLFWQASRNL